MTNAKHTPAPWHYSKAHNDIITMQSMQDDIVCDIANINEANAHLIAAAPELLEALENVRLHKCMYDDDDAFFVACGKVQMAIAKAKGGAK